MSNLRTAAAELIESLKDPSDLFRINKAIGNVNTALSEPQEGKIYKKDEWINVEKYGYPPHNGDFLCKVLVVEECGVIQEKDMVLPFVFNEKIRLHDVKSPRVAKLKNGEANEYGCNQFVSNMKEPFTVIDWMKIPERLKPEEDTHAPGSCPL